MFRPEQKNLIEIFQSDMQYIIPEYQRPYSWDCIGKSNKNNQVNLMWDDLFEYFESKGENPYFFGSMVLIGKEEDRNFAVVDGQQRLTTLVLFFAAIKCFLQKVKTEDDHIKNFTKEADTIIENLIFNKKIFGVISINKKLKIERNFGFDYDLILESAVNCGNKSAQEELSIEQTAIVNRYFNNRNFFEEKLFEHFSVKGTLDLFNADRLNNFIALIQYKVTIVRILAEEQDVAFKIFEILNNRGLPLSNKDLFRNFLIKEFATLKQRNEQKFLNLNPNQKWIELEKTGYLSDEFISRFVENKRGGQQKYSAFNDLLELYEKKYTATLNQSKIELLYQDIQTYLSYFELINNELLIESKEIRSRVAFLMNAGNERYAENLLLALFNATNYKGEEHDFINKFLINYELFILKTMLKTDVRFSNAPIYTAINYLNDLKLQEAYNVFDLMNDYESTIAYIINTQNLNNETAKILLSKYYWWQERNAEQDVVSQQFHFDKATLEHIIPQQPEQNTNWLKDFSKEFRNDFTYKLGNMTLLTQKMNSAAKNYDYSKKIMIYKKTLLTMTSSLPDVITENTIRERHNEIVNGILEDLKLL